MAMLTLSNRTCFCMQSDEALSIYLEYVSGGSIHKLLREYGPFKEPVIRNYTGQILAGLAYLHGRNAVHRLFCYLKLCSCSIGIVI
jgi:serine/threonine protein kinase